MAYFVECSCGNRVSVTAAQAGGEVRCECERSIAVPRLSELRQAAGQGAFESGTISTIRRMMDTRTLQSSRECAITGQETDDIVMFHVECERVWRRGPSKATWWLVLFIFILPIWIVWLVATHLLTKKEEEFGRETAISVPLRVGHDQLACLRRMNQWELQRLLRTVPIYATLLDEYPRANITIDSDD